VGAYPRYSPSRRPAVRTATREAIRSAICERGWSERAGAYTQAFGADDLDASNLMLAITGFLPGDDPRMKATIDATAERLGDERGLVYRYRAAAYGNDVGLLAEELDVGAAETIGNHPRGSAHRPGQHDLSDPQPPPGRGRR
jgi:alpha,alpha-trehalase